MARRADDLIPEESNTVQLALKRLPPKEAYDRVFRLRRAFQVPHSCSGEKTPFLTRNKTVFAIASITTGVGAYQARGGMAR